MKNEKRKYFITGILIVLPVLVTLYFFISLFSFFDNILGRYISRVTMEFLGYKIPGLGLIVFLIIIFATGFFATNFIGRKILLYVEKIWFNLPIVKRVYPAVKQVTHFLFDEKIQGKFQKVALVEYPSKGIYSIGFVTNDAAGIIRHKTGKDLLNILIPSVPNPLTGFLIFLPREDVVLLDMTVEEAIKMVVSGGVFNPADLRG